MGIHDAVLGLNIMLFFKKIQMATSPAPVTVGHTQGIKEWLTLYPVDKDHNSSKLCTASTVRSNQALGSNTRQ